MRPGASGSNHWSASPTRLPRASCIKADKSAPEPEWATVPHWKLLSGTEQQPWLEQARRELVAIHTGSGITPKPKLVEVRAKNLYEVSLKKLQEVSLGAEDAGLRG